LIINPHQILRSQHLKAPRVVTHTAATLLLLCTAPLFLLTADQGRRSLAALHLAVGLYDTHTTAAVGELERALLTLSCLAPWRFVLAPICSTFSTWYVHRVASKASFVLANPAQAWCAVLLNSAVCVCLALTATVSWCMHLHRLTHV
jgi:hypothetical protein